MKYKARWQAKIKEETLKFLITDYQPGDQLYLISPW